MFATLLSMIPSLASTGINIYQAISGHAASNDIGKAVALLPLAAGVYSSLQQIGDTLQKAQSEKWAEDDARWTPVFEAADKALAAAEARLEAPGT